MATKVRVFKIDPVKKTAIAMNMDCNQNGLRRFLKAKANEELGEHRFKIGDVTYSIIGRMGLEPGGEGFRLRGFKEATQGLSILAERGASGGLADITLLSTWVEREIIWIDAVPEDDEEIPEGEVVSPNV